VPDVQKKSGRVVPGVKEEPIESDQETKPKKMAKAKAVKVEDDKPQNKKKRKAEEAEPPAKKSRGAQKKTPATAKTTPVKAEKTAAADSKVELGRRRSGRLRGEAA
jgi:formamidopyrimidine-DNA glycosylase